jgi:peroxiredoxin
LTLEDPGFGVERRLDARSGLRTLVLPVALLALIVGGLWYWQGRGDGGSGSPYGPVALPEARNATDRGPAPEEGRAAPDFLLERLGGGTQRLSDFQGQPVLLNFWASWCPPCKEEMPEIVRQYEANKDAGLVVVAVNLQEADARISDFADEFGMDFPIVIDRSGDVAETWRIGGAFEGLPSSYFLDAQGVVRAVYNQPLTEESIAEGLTTILSGEVA